MWCESTIPWVPRRAVAKFFWRFLSSSLKLVLNYANNIIVHYDSGKRDYPRCGRESEDLVGVGFMPIAYDKDLNGNMY